MVLKNESKKQLVAGLERLGGAEDFSIVDILGEDAWGQLSDQAKRTIARDFCELVRNSPTSFPGVETVEYPMLGDQLYRFGKRE